MKMIFKKRTTYKLKNIKYGTTFTGRLARNRSGLLKEPTLTGVDQSGTRCHLTVDRANRGDWVLCN